MLFPMLGSGIWGLGGWWRALEGNNKVSLCPLNPMIGNLIRCMATALVECTAAYPDDDRQPLSEDGLSWTPDVKVQAILTLGVRVLELGHNVPKDARFVAAVLHANWLVRCRVKSNPVVDGFLRRHEPQRSHGWAAVWDTKPLVHIRDHRVDQASVYTACGFDCEALASAAILFFDACDDAWK